MALKRAKSLIREHFGLVVTCLAGLTVLGLVFGFPLILFYFSMRPFGPLQHPPGYDRLMAAIENGDPKAVREVLNSGVDPNRYPTSRADEQDEDDIAPLDDAAEDGNVAIVRALLDAGADPNMGDGWHSCPLAAAKSRRDIMSLLIRRGAKVNDMPTGSRALYDAATDGNLGAVEFLLDHGANPNTSWAGSNDHERLIDVVKDLSGPNSKEVVALLRRYGAS